jgi:hypothetical protein
MATLDAHTWAIGVTLRSFGRVVGVRASDARLLPTIEAALPPGWQRDDETRVSALFSVLNECGRFAVYSGAKVIARTDREIDLRALLAQAIRLDIARHAEHHTFLHAGAVEWRGHGIVLPGRSHDGKTTLVSALLRLGAGYLSDECAPLDDDGLVAPYARNLQIRQLQGSKISRPAAAFGAGPVPAPVPVSLVAVAPYSPDAGVRLRETTGGEAVLQLLPHAIPTRRDPASTLRRLQRVQERALVLAGERGDADETARVLIDTLEMLLFSHTSEQKA